MVELLAQIQESKGRDLKSSKNLNTGNEAFCINSDDLRKCQICLIFFFFPSESYSVVSSL